MRPAGRAARPATGRRAAELRRLRGGRAIRRAGRGGPPGFRGDRAQRRRGRLASAVTWTACRWPSSWPRPGCGCCPPSRSRPGWATGSRLLGPGGRTAPPRQQTLRATIDWSYELLSGPEQVLLRRLSVFAGWSLDMAEQVCADRLCAEEMLGLPPALVDKSLVVVEPEVPARPGTGMLDTHPRVRRPAAGRRGRGRRRPAPAAGLRADRVRARRGGRHGGDPGPLASRGRRVPPLRRGQRQRAPGARPLPGHRGRARAGCGCAPRSGRAGSSAATSPRARSGSPASWPWTAPGCRPRCSARRWSAGPS